MYTCLPTSLPSAGQRSILEVVRLCNVIYEPFYDPRFRPNAYSQKWVISTHHADTINGIISINKLRHCSNRQSRVLRRTTTHVMDKCETSDAYTHARTPARTRARTHARTNERTNVRMYLRLRLKLHSFINKKFWNARTRACARASWFSSYAYIVRLSYRFQDFACRQWCMGHSRCVGH